MITLKKTIIPLCILLTCLSFSSYSQSKKINLETWNSFKESAHKIGFCVYHVQMKACNQHSKIKLVLEKISEPESDINYFEMKDSWANKRLIELAKTQKSNSADYFILFDIDQKSFKKLYHSKKTSNSYLKFSIFDIKKQIPIQCSTKIKYYPSIQYCIKFKKFDSNKYHVERIF